MRRYDEPRAAPAALRADLPNDIDAVIRELHRHALPAAADEYLRLAIYDATHHVYAGLALLAALTLVVVLLIPRHFAHGVGLATERATPER